MGDSAHFLHIPGFSRSSRFGRSFIEKPLKRASKSRVFGENGKHNAAEASFELAFKSIEKQLRHLLGIILEDTTAPGTQDKHIITLLHSDGKHLIDPTIDDVKSLCTSMRRNSKEDRVLFHYNGHGVPRPTQNGEIWVFNKSFTQVDNPDYLEE